MEHYITLQGVKVHYEETGNAQGAPVLLLHGWGCNTTTVASIRRILDSGLHVFSIDFPGHGKSDEPDSVWGVEEYTRMTEEFVKRLGISAPILIGHSFGGRVSILFSSRNETAKVILVDAAGIKPRRSMKYKLRVGSFKAMKRVAPAILGKSLGGKVIEGMRKKFGSSDYASASPVMRAILSKCVNEDLREMLPRIKASTLLIWGEDDTATPVSDARLMEKLIPDAGLVVFPGCGHYSFLDNPVGFRAVLQEFLKSELNRK